MINLRPLQEKDASYMLEWMHDKDIQKCFQKNMMNMSLDDAREFCRKAQIPVKLLDGCSIHFAIADEYDEYLGTVSLKNYDEKNRTAEYAISTRRKAHGHGIASLATKMLLNKAFYEYALHRVYLNVLAENKAAIRLYQNTGFVYEGESREHLLMNGKYKTLKWYGMLEDEFRNRYGNGSV